MPGPSHSSRFYHRTVLGEQCISLSSSLCSFVLHLCINYNVHFVLEPLFFADHWGGGGAVAPKTNNTSKITVMSLEAFSKSSLTSATSSRSRTTLDQFMNPYDMSEVLRAWVVTPCGLVGRYKCLGWIFCPSFQVRDIASYPPHYTKPYNTCV